MAINSCGTNGASSLTYTQSLQYQQNLQNVTYTQTQSYASNACYGQDQFVANSQYQLQQQPQQGGWMQQAMQQFMANPFIARFMQMIGMGQQQQQWAQPQAYGQQQHATGWNPYQNGQSQHPPGTGAKNYLSLLNPLSWISGKRDEGPGSKVTNTIKDILMPHRLLKKLFG